MHKPCCLFSALSQTLDLEQRLPLKFFVVELGKILRKFPELMTKYFSQNKKPSNRVIVWSSLQKLFPLFPELSQTSDLETVDFGILLGRTPKASVNAARIDKNIFFTKQETLCLNNKKYSCQLFQNLNKT